MAAVGLNVVNAESRDDVSGELEQVYSGKAGIAIPIVRAHNICAKRVRRDGDTLAGVGGEKNVWFGIGICNSAGKGRRDSTNGQSR